MQQLQNKHHPNGPSARADSSLSPPVIVHPIVSASQENVEICATNDSNLTNSNNKNNEVLSSFWATSDDTDGGGSNSGIVRECDDTFVMHTGTHDNKPITSTPQPSPDNLPTRSDVASGLSDDVIRRLTYAAPPKMSQQLPQQKPTSMERPLPQQPRQRLPSDPIVESHKDAVICNATFIAPERTDDATFTGTGCAEESAFDGAEKANDATFTRVEEVDVAARPVSAGAPSNATYTKRAMDASRGPSLTEDSNDSEQTAPFVSADEAQLYVTFSPRKRRLLSCNVTFTPSSFAASSTPFVNGPGGDQRGGADGSRVVGGGLSAKLTGPPVIFEGYEDESVGGGDGGASSMTPERKTERTMRRSMAKMDLNPSGNNAFR